MEDGSQADVTTAGDVRVAVALDGLHELIARVERAVGTVARAANLAVCHGVADDIDPVALDDARAYLRRAVTSARNGRPDAWVAKDLGVAAGIVHAAPAPHTSGKGWCRRVRSAILLLVDLGAGIVPDDEPSRNPHEAVDELVDEADWVADDLWDCRDRPVRYVMAQTGIPGPSLNEAMGVETDDWQRWATDLDQPPPEPHLARLTALAAAVHHLRDVFTGRGVTGHWLHQPRHELDGDTPADRLRTGSELDLAELVDLARADANRA